MYKNLKYIYKKKSSRDMVGKPQLLSRTSLRTIDWGKEFRFLNDTCDKSKVQIEQFDSTHKDIYHCSDLLSKEQCDQIISKADDLDFQFCSYGEERNNSRLVLFDEDFSNYIWESINKAFNEMLGDEKIQPFGFDVLKGTWKLCGVNEAMRLNRYSGESKEFFGPHRDAPFCPNGDKRSLYTILIYLNDDFRGGETVFHLPENSCIDTKGCTMDEEIEKHGGIENFEHIHFSPKAGDAVIFKQNIIHEGNCLLSKRKFKFVIKTDIMVEREGFGVGFSPPVEEREDFFECLQLFRQAQQFELSLDPKENKKANYCYEKSLSIRYSYPNKHVNITCDSHEIPVSSNGGNISTTEPSLSKIFVKTPWSIFPKEVWHTIMLFVGDCKTLQNLCEVFPDLLPEMERVLKESLIPKLIYHNGIFTKFQFDNTNVVYESLLECARLVAMYSMFLLGNSPDTTHYLVSYDKEKGEANTVELKDLLVAAAIEKPVYGTIFKVKQQKEEKEPNKDLYHSVDRQLMATYFDRDDFGIDLESEQRSSVSLLSYTSTYTVSTIFLPESKEIQDQELRQMFNKFDRYYEFCKNYFDDYKYSHFESTLNAESKESKLTFRPSLKSRTSAAIFRKVEQPVDCLLYTSPSPRDS